MKLTSYADPMKRETVCEFRFSDEEVAHLSPETQSNLLKQLEILGSDDSPISMKAHAVSLLAFMIEVNSLKIDQTKAYACQCHLPQIWGHDADCPEYNPDGSKK